MSTLTYNLPAQHQPDTLRPLVMTLEYNKGGQVKSLAGARVVFSVVRGKASKVYLQLTSDNGEIVIQDPNTGLVEILPVKDHGLVAGTYQYSVRVHYADQTVITFLGGDLRIVSAIDGFKPEEL